MKKKPHPLKGRKWSAETRAKYQATRAANRGLQPVHASTHEMLKNVRPDSRVSDAILYLRNAVRSIRLQDKFSEADLLVMLALKCLQGDK